MIVEFCVYMLMVKHRRRKRPVPGSYVKWYCVGASSFSPTIKRGGTKALRHNLFCITSNFTSWENREKKNCWRKQKALPLSLSKSCKMVAVFFNATPFFHFLFLSVWQVVWLKWLSNTTQWLQSLGSTYILVQLLHWKVHY